MAHGKRLFPICHMPFPTHTRYPIPINFMNSYSSDFKSLISDHYKNIQVFSEEFQNAKAEKIIKILKENIFCETIEKEDEFEILASDEFLNKD